MLQVPLNQDFSKEGIVSDAAVSSSGSSSFPPAAAPSTHSAAGSSEPAGEKSDHWSSQVVEAIVSVGSSIEGTTAGTAITVLGGSDNGEFPYLGEISAGVRYQKGGPSLAPGALLLEVQGQRVAGYTQRDVVAWINHCTRNGNPCVIRTAPPGK
ncbi:hypothetical protein Pmani_009823 [Petrolisthes manimaculis]|uniref:PDZ domain-containing protein n=1 Tax=Petrolisthes manimaculis TaxID=1843537 RepID=A0AAE1Q3X7_9EUCA|nr:hypothetical protein Pmani_009823 [Petrolisthes manimaculis]